MFNIETVIIGRLTMSKQNVLAFDLRIRGDKDLQSRVKALPANDAEGLVKLGAEAGFNFSANELLEVIGNSRKSEELSNAELDKVAGGFNPQPDPPAFQLGSPIMFHFMPPTAK